MPYGCIDQLGNLLEWVNDILRCQLLYQFAGELRRWSAAPSAQGDGDLFERAEICEYDPRTNEAGGRASRLPNERGLRRLLVAIHDEAPNPIDDDLHLA